MKLSLDDIHYYRLCRYRPDSDCAFESFFNNEIVATIPSNLNDIRDCCIDYDREKLFAFLKPIKVFRKMCSDFCLDGKYTTPFGAFGHLNLILLGAYNNENFPALDNPKYHEKCLEFTEFLANDFIEIFRRSFYIVSFTGKNFDPIMWSHYSHDSRGFIEIYNVKPLYECINNFIDSDNRILRIQKDIFGFFKVKYVSRRSDHSFLLYLCLKKYMSGKGGIKEVLKLTKSKRIKTLFIDSLTTKDKNWEYEEEIRVILPRHESVQEEIRDAIDFSPNFNEYKTIAKIKPYGIFVGDKMKNFQYRLIHDFCNNNDIKIGQLDRKSMWQCNNVATIFMDN